LRCKRNKEGSEVEEESQFATMFLSICGTRFKGIGVNHITPCEACIHDLDSGHQQILELRHINCFLKVTMQECVIDFKLSDLSVLSSSKTKHYANGCWLDDKVESVSVIESFLSVTFCYKAHFMKFN
jgi:hypothetical protein